MSNEIATIETTRAVTVSPQLNANDLLNRLELIQDVKRRVMKADQHYGIIPGTQKPTLLQPGAQLLCLVFKLRPEYKIRDKAFPNGHLAYEVICKLIAADGEPAGEGVGYCSTLESKYRWRNAARLCPECGKPAIIKGKDEYGGGWLCFKKKDGCGAKFADGDTSIESQESGRVENPDIADVYNTVLKIAKKRAYVDATLSATAASDQFTQDMEDFRNQPDDDDRPRNRDVRREQPQQSQRQQSAPKQTNGADSNQNFKRPARPSGCSKEFAEIFFDRAVDIIDPEQYGDVFPNKMGDVFKWLNESGTLKACGIESHGAFLKSTDKDALANVFEALTIEAQARLDIASEKANDRDTH